MNNNVVVAVVRLQSGEDVIGILCGDIDNQLKMEFPYFVVSSPTTSKLIMTPYCPLTDEIIFYINKSRVEFVVPASEDVSKSFLEMLNNIYTPKSTEQNQFTNYVTSSDLVH